MDIDSVSDCDEDIEMQDIDQLNAALEADDRDVLRTCQPSTSTAGLNNIVYTENQQKLAKIEYALALNKLTDDKLRKLETVLLNRLRECRERLEDKSIESNNVEKDRTFKYLNCGRPYFKDKSGFAPPDNEDTILMAKSNMYDFSTVTSVPGWTVKDKSDFISLLHKMSIAIKKTQLQSQISQITRDAKAKGASSRKAITAVKKEIENLKHKSFAELALPPHEHYDWDFVANKMNYRHNAQEYQALWQLFLHPSINKNSWNKVEHAQLQKIAKSNNLQLWEKTAEELNTGRTGYQCFVYFRTNLSNTFTGNKWSKEEEEYLKRVIEYYREADYIPWSKIATLMENRTKIQIYNKHFSLLQNRKGRFVPEEDVVLLTCVKNFGQNFKKILKYLPGRAVSQLRNRYEVLMNTEGTRTSMVWTIDEDRKLIQFLANQDTTLSNFSSIQKHFNGKTRAHLRTRYITLLKWMKKNPNLDITKAPRRGARRLVHGEASKDLGTAMEKLKSRIQTDVHKKKVKQRINKDAPEEEIETAIVAALVNEHIQETELKKAELIDSETSILSGPWNYKCGGNHLKQLLLLLKSKLDKTALQQSCYEPQYKSLTNSEECLLVKSYSRKQKVQIFGLNGPDVWGERMLETSDYVLPPNYNTITGCRKLMTYVTSKPKNDNVVLSLLAKRNVILNDQLELLMERFKTLFLWPMLLSNETPRHKNDMEALSTLYSQNPGSSVSLGGNVSITIPISGASISYEGI